MHAVTDRAEPFQLKGASFTLFVLKVLDPADERFFPQLQARVRQAPSLFRGAPVVLDMSDPAAAEKLDLEEFVAQLRETGLVPIGVQGGSRQTQDAAIKGGLSVLSGGRPSRMVDAEPPPPAMVSSVPAPSPAPAPTAADDTAKPAPVRNTLVISDPVRSGRRVYSRGDLIALAPVSQGAELLADGHIHIYSSLRGRAIAGLNGDRGARIFCHNLQAELVSIAGLYRVSEDMDRKFFKKPVQIHLEADRLRIDLLS